MWPQFVEFTIDADGAQVRRASEWLSKACQRRGVPEVSTQRLELCLNEVLANVISHGGTAARSAPVRLTLQVVPDGDCSEGNVTVSDAGRAFDPKIGRAHI